MTNRAEHVYIDLSGCEDATVVTITGWNDNLGQVSYTFAIPIPEVPANEEQVIVDAAKTGYRRYIDRFANK
jgi:hypothetical protein